ncbi:MAG: putative glycolipid-binding domain-containing protein, partial [Acidimicrobiia bacterium]|nr:putative glycolipid-binding domain-containing protein [Acidimicrobiia bacterium]
MTSILWRRIDRTSYERCTLDDTAAGHRLAGTVLLVEDRAPHEIRYTVVTDATWRPITVGINVQGGANDRTLALSGDGEGTWSVGDAPVLELYGATDVDFGFTPGTNTLPIKRLGLEVGESAQITAIRIDFPER